MYMHQVRNPYKYLGLPACGEIGRDTSLKITGCLCFSPGQMRGSPPWLHRISPRPDPNAAQPAARCCCWAGFLHLRWPVGGRIFPPCSKGGCIGTPLFCCVCVGSFIVFPGESGEMRIEINDPRLINSVRGKKKRYLSWQRQAGVKCPTAMFRVQSVCFPKFAAGEGGRESCFTCAMDRDAKQPFFPPHDQLCNCNAAARAPRCWIGGRFQFTPYIKKAPARARC